MSHPARIARVILIATAATTVMLTPTTTVGAAVGTVPPAGTSPAPVASSIPAPAPSPAPSPVGRFASVELRQAPPARVLALQHAVTRIGKPYRYGGTGPNAFDCSGLVLWSYRQVGVSLPRTSRAMSARGTPVSRAALQPGDLVFFYRPVSHVGIYLGDGKVVHASSSRSPVKISQLSRMPFNSARRV